MRQGRYRSLLRQQTMHATLRQLIEVVICVYRYSDGDIDTTKFGEWTEEHKRAEN